MRSSPGLCSNEIARAFVNFGYFFKSGLNASTRLKQMKYYTIDISETSVDHRAVKTQ